MDILFSQMMVTKGQYVSASEYAQALDERYQAQQNLMGRHRASLSPKVQNFYSAKAKYQREADRLYWVLYRYHQLDASAVRSAKQQLNIGGTALSNDPSAIQNVSYKNALKASAIANYLPNDPFQNRACLLYTSPSPRDQRGSRMPSSA